MTQAYETPNLTCESESDVSESFWSDSDEDRFCGDAEWEMSLAAIAWEARRKLFIIKWGCLPPGFLPVVGPD